VRKAYNFHVPIVLKSESLNLLEPSGPVQGLSRAVQGCPGIALAYYKQHNSHRLETLKLAQTLANMVWAFKLSVLSHNAS
jgi:hypothetical protein